MTQSDNPGDQDTAGKGTTTGFTGISTAPYLFVSDVLASAAYYREKLGFDRESFWGEPPCFCITTMGKASLMLSQLGENAGRKIIPNNSQDGRSWDAYVWVTGVDTLYAYCRASGANIVREIETADYGCREFDVLDPDGYRISFGEVLG